MYAALVRRHFYTVVRAIMLVGLLGALAFASSTLAGCSTAGDDASGVLSEKDYVSAVKDALAEFDEAFSGYSDSLGGSFGAYTSGDVFTDEDIETIAVFCDEFEAKATTALERLEGLAAPESYAQEHRAISAYAKFARENLIGELVAPMRALEAGDTVDDFSARTTLTEQQQAVLDRLKAEFDTAVESLGITTAESTESG